MIRWLGVAVALAASPAQAVIHCNWCDQMVSDADLVVQSGDAKIAEADAAGNCALAGPAARVFVGALAVGDRV